MCGIYGYIGKNKQILKLILKSLKILRSRGYDSYGFSYYNKNKFEIEKTIDRNLDNVFVPERLDIEGNTIITHTRWATNGKVSTNNTHPFISTNGKFILVHNGIIENANTIRNELKNYKKFSSDTDSEVIVNLLEYLYEKYPKINIVQTITKTLSKLKGYWSLLIYKTDEPNNLYVSRNQTPLLIGFNKQEIHLSSDSNTFADYVDYYFELDNLDTLCLKYDSETDSVNTDSFDNYKLLEVEKKKIVCESPTPYNYWLEKEIYEQPKEIHNFLTRNNIYVNNNLLYFPDFDNNFKKLNIHFSNIILLGSGTSYHACILGEYFFKRNSEYNIRAFNVSEFSLDDLPVQNTLFIMISQSGETKDIYDMIIKIRGTKDSIYKYRFLSITNSINSLIPRNCDLNLYLKLSKEMSVASTKTFTCSSLMLYIISLKLTSSFDMDHIFDFGNTISVHLEKLDKKIINLVDKLYNKNLIFLASTFKNIPISHESSLKIREICYKWSISSSAKNLKHGPLALIDNNTYVLHLISDKNDYNNSHHVAHEINSRRGKNIAITTYKDLDNELYEDIIYINTNSLNLNTLLLVIPTQLLTLHLGKKLGNNIDMPRNLAKTVTV